MSRVETTIASLAVLLLLALVPVVLPVGASAATCTTTVSSVGAVATAVSSAASGSVVCLADGSYGKLTLSASKAAPGVTVQAEHPGLATIAGATLDGSYLTIAQFRMTGTFEPRPGSTGMTADHNLFVGGSYYAVMAAATTTTTVNDVTITNNRFQGRFDEDAMRLNRYHDGSDADPYGILIEGNEFSGNVEYGGHNDVLQSVWVGDHLYFRKNYLHDFGGQGFFVKDQASAIDGLVVEDNLIVRQNLPCDPTSLCPNWQLSPFQVFGPLKNVSIRHNTVWPGSGGGTQWLRGDDWQGPTVVSDNVFSNLNSDAGGLTTAYTGSNNTNCGGYGFPSIGLISDCSPAFADAANGDYRLANGRGVTWRVADQQYGPGTSTATTPPPPPSSGDTTPPDTTISSGPGSSTASTSASFSFTATQWGSTFQCRLDYSAYAACTSPKSYSGLSTGSHTFSVRAIDPAGNTDATPATQTWTIAPDQDPGQPLAPADAPPTAELNAPANGATAGSTLLLTPTVADDRGIGHVEFWLDDALLDRDDNPPFRTQIDTDRLSDATHTISLRVFDTSGEAVSTAVRLRVVTDDGTSSVRRGADLSSAPVGEGVTRLQGDTTPGSGVLVSLTPCTSQAGTITDRFALLGDDAGSLDMLYAQGDQCLLELQRLQR